MSSPAQSVHTEKLYLTTCGSEYGRGLYIMYVCMLRSNLTPGFHTTECTADLNGVLYHYTLISPSSGYPWQQRTLFSRQASVPTAFGLRMWCLAHTDTSVVTETASPAPSSLHMTLASLRLGSRTVSTRTHLHATRTVNNSLSTCGNIYTSKATHTHDWAGPCT